MKWDTYTFVWRRVVKFVRPTTQRRISKIKKNVYVHVWTINTDKFLSVNSRLPQKVNRKAGILSCYFNDGNSKRHSTTIIAF